MTDSALLSALKPTLGAPQPGLYAPPEPTRVLAAEVAQGQADVAYTPLDLAEAQNLPDVVFGFALTGAVACPPAGVQVRAFERDRPERVCLFTRSETCEWQREGACAHVEAIFGRAPATIVQSPDGALLLDQQRCPPVAARNQGGDRGESRAWMCGQKLVAAQEQPRNKSGEPWAASSPVAFNRSELGRPGGFGQGPTGAFFAFQLTNNVHLLARLFVQQGRTELQMLDSPVIQAFNGLATSADGLDVTFSEALNDLVAAGEQCLVLTNDAQSERIATKTGPNSVRLSPPGLGAFNTAAWQITGDPGPNFNNLTATQVGVAANLGALVGLSYRRDAAPPELVVVGATRSYVSERVLRFSELHRYGCAHALPHALGALHTVAGRNQLYSLMPNGLVAVAEDGTTSPPLVAPGATFSAADRVIRVGDVQNDDHVLVWQPLTGALHHFVPAENSHEVQTLNGSFLGAFDGPLVAYRPGAALAEVRVLALGGETTSYTLPAFTEGQVEPVNLSSAGAVRLRGRTVIVFSSGSFVGALDLTSGLSQAVPVGENVQVQVGMVDDFSTEVWGVARLPGSPETVQMVRFPLLDP